ncbi:MAG: GAF domain-containing protein [Ktedonobacteraceae bacterium]|nr:GAF domain-containing protein [Ktedonobacteraceae bacterium]
MVEQKMPSTRYIPLRVRFRASSESARLEREVSQSSQETFQDAEPLVPDLADVSEAQRRTQQVKELVRLATLLRADLNLDTILQQFAASIAACTGFRSLVINLIDEKTNIVKRAAFAGVTEADQRKLLQKRLTADWLKKRMRPEFRISQSYFISHHSSEACTNGVAVMPMEKYEVGGWHPDDSLLVPLFSLREGRILGYLSLDYPEDGKIPTEESVEMVELFANQVAIAIDNARLLQEREEERQALEQGLAVLRDDLERLRSGQFYEQVCVVHPRLQSIGETINVMVREINQVLKNLQMITQAVDDHTRHVQRNTERLAYDRELQENHVRQISHVIHSINERGQSISEHVNKLAKRAEEAVDIIGEAQRAVDRALEGMSRVREATIQSVRTMKSLGESSQEINESVTAITELSMHMHLLSLNAAIEAARAGEQGQRFAVIVKEMRTLAKSCTEAARRIGNSIRTFQQETAAASHSVEQSTQHVVVQTELVTQTGVALEAISTVTEQLNNLVNEICTMIEKQAEGSKQVIRAISDISSTNEDNTSHTHEIQQSLAHLVELTDSLRSRMAALHLTGD